MSEVRAKLIVQQGPEPGETFRLEQHTIRIGRSATNDIAIQDAEISRQHAQLIRQGAGYAIQDLGSTNGTFVNYQRVTGLLMLNHGDLISLGEAIILTYWDESAAASQPVPSPKIGEQPAATAVSPAPGPIIQTVPPPPPSPQATVYPDSPARWRRWVVGCVVAFWLIICLCLATLFFLDAYQQGQYLYCGGLRPFWELILGPFGFNPICP